MGIRATVDVLALTGIVVVVLLVLELIGAGVVLVGAERSGLAASGRRVGVDETILCCCTAVDFG